MGIPFFDRDVPCSITAIAIWSNAVESYQKPKFCARYRSDIGLNPFVFKKNMFIHVALNGEIFWTCGNSQIGIRFEPPYVKPTTGTPETQAHWFGRFPKEASSFQLHSCVGIDANTAQKIKLRLCRRHDSRNALSNCDLAAMFAGKKQGWLNYVALLDTTCWVVMFNLNRIWHHKKNWHMHTHFYPM